MAKIICGIYKIACTANNKVYIGQSIDIKRRWKEHKRRLNSGTHENLHLQNAWNKYGEYQFKFEILEKCDEIHLNERETFYINLHQSYNNEFGYNKTMGGHSFLYFKDSNNETISIQNSLDLKKKRVLQFDFDGNLIRIWESVNSIFKENPDWSQTPLRRCLRMEKGVYTFKNSFWFYEEGFMQEMLYDLMNLKKQSDKKQSERNRTIGSAFLTKLNKERGIKINQYNSEWQFIKTWSSITELEKNGFSRHSIKKSISNLSLYKNYYFTLVS